MRYFLALIFLFTCSTSYACPLEPDIENYEGVQWSLNPSLGVVVRFPVGDEYIYYAHPETNGYGNNYGCVPHPKGGCKLIIYKKLEREIVFIDGNNYHTTTIHPTMCRMEGQNWEAFYLMSYERKN